MKCALTTQTKFVNCIISLKDKEHSINSLCDKLTIYCNDKCELYAYIVHDKDMKEDNTPKTTHIHCCMLMKTNRQRLSTILNELSSFLDISSLAISIEKMNDVSGSIQYLVHKNEVSKVQYDIANIKSNLSLEELNVYMTSQSGQLSVNTLLDIIWSCGFSRIKIMKQIGLGYYHLYRNVINDIIGEYQGKI